MAQRAECQFEMAEVLVQCSLGQHFVAGYFCFHVVKPVIPILLLLPILCVCEKLEYHTNLEKLSQSNAPGGV